MTYFIIQIMQKEIPNSISFNQDQTLFSITIGHKFFIYETKSAKLKIEREMPFEIQAHQMYLQSNIMVFTNQDIKERVYIWDDSKKKMIAEINNKVKQPVISIAINAMKLGIVYLTKIIIYNLDNKNQEFLKKELALNTFANPEGILIIGDHCICAPSEGQGKIIIIPHNQKGFETKESHEQKLVILSLCKIKLASASEAGKVIKIHNSKTGDLIQLLRRGTDSAQILEIQICDYGNYLCCFSSQGTLHLFTLELTDEEKKMNSSKMQEKSKTVDIDQNPISAVYQSLGKLDGSMIYTNMNKQSKFRFLGSVVKYFNSEWSFAKYHLNNNLKTIIHFSGVFNITVVQLNGKIYQFAFDPINGGELIKLKENQFI